MWVLLSDLKKHSDGNDIEWEPLYLCSSHDHPAWLCVHLVETTSLRTLTAMASRRMGIPVWVEITVRTRGLSGWRHYSCQLPCRNRGDLVKAKMILKDRAIRARVGGRDGWLLLSSDGDEQNEQIDAAE